MFESSVGVFPHLSTQLIAWVAVDSCCFGVRFYTCQFEHLGEASGHMMWQRFACSSRHACIFFLVDGRYSDAPLLQLSAFLQLASPFYFFATAWEAGQIALAALSSLAFP